MLTRTLLPRVALFSSILKTIFFIRSATQQAVARLHSLFHTTYLDEKYFFVDQNSDASHNTGIIFSDPLTHNRTYCTEKIPHYLLIYPYYLSSIPTDVHVHSYRWLLRTNRFTKHFARWVLHTNRYVPRFSPVGTVHE
jgi:hypothetical protein